MFIKQLIIQSNMKIIRNIKFHAGLNLIVDETINIMDVNDKQSGNSVGKTTVLKLIDFCLGADAGVVYTDPENKKNIDRKTKDFLIENEVLISLVLTENLHDYNASEYIIQRNFLSRKAKICAINDVQYKDGEKTGEKGSNESEFDLKLKEIMFPNLANPFPTFRQLIAHNIRYKDIRISNTTKYLDSYTKPFEYETLFLYLFGCPTDNSEAKLKLQESIKQEKSFIRKLLNNQDENSYQYAMKLLDNDIQKLEKQRGNLNINPEHMKEIEQLDENRVSQNAMSTLLSTYRVKLDIVKNSIYEIEKSKTEINEDDLRRLYNEASSYVGSLPTKFEELVSYHNSILEDRRDFLSKEKTNIFESIEQLEFNLENLMSLEKEFVEKIKKSGTLEDFELISNKLNMKFQEKGQYENILKQIFDSNETMKKYEKEVEELEQSLFSEVFENKVAKQVEKFNVYFSEYFKELYGDDENWLLKHEIRKTSNNQKYYDFSTYSMNTSSGKKQGEILAFDLAYIAFANEGKIPQANFLLNDKKELMYNQQIIDIFNIIDTSKVQVVFPILKEKIPRVFDNDNYIILRLSDGDKLFRIEDKEKF